jgi:4-hydroxybenzoate polyprenyltransferase
VSHPLGRLALLHPFPSALNALLVAALAIVAGASPSVVLALAAAMFAFQVSIGALNDLVDAPIDAVVKPAKPIPSGQVSPRTARLIVVGGGAIGLALSASVSPAAVMLGAIGYGAGVAYDLAIKRMGLGWLGFTIAFPVLLLYAWTGAGAGLPPGWATLLPVAALAGPALQLSNALTDLDHDRATGTDGLAVRLGRGRAVAVLAALLLAVHALAWWTLLAATPPVAAVAAAAVASATALVGVAATAAGTPRSTAWGWTLQCLAIALLAVAWVVVAAA